MTNRADSDRFDQVSASGNRRGVGRNGNVVFQAACTSGCPRRAHLEQDNSSQPEQDDGQG